MGNRCIEAFATRDSSGCRLYDIDSDNASYTEAMAEEKEINWDKVVF